MPPACHLEKHKVRKRTSLQELKRLYFDKTSTVQLHTSFHTDVRHEKVKNSQQLKRLTSLDIFTHLCKLCTTHVSSLIIKQSLASTAISVWGSKVLNCWHVGKQRCWKKLLKFLFTFFTFSMFTWLVWMKIKQIIAIHFEKLIFDQIRKSRRCKSHHLPTRQIPLL